MFDYGDVWQVPRCQSKVATSRRVFGVSDCKNSVEIFRKKPEVLSASFRCLKRKYLLVNGCNDDPLRQLPGYLRMWQNTPNSPSEDQFQHVATESK